jgi:hypothetical protein
MALEVVDIILSIASMGMDMYSILKKEDHIKEINKAYRNALKKWCRNNYIRSSIASRFKDIDNLVSYIADNGQLSSLGPEYLSFLPLWEDELRNNALTYAYLNELLNRQQLEIGNKLLIGQSAAMQKIDELGLDISRRFDRLEQMLLPRETIVLIPASSYTPIFYEEQENYIRRKVRDYNNADHLSVYLNPERYKRQPLIDYLIAESDKAQRIVLYSEAQLGKSTELKQLAHETQASELFNTILFELKIYTVGPLLDDSKLAYLLNESSKRSLLILDGLDEVKDEQRQDAINQIEHLSAEYPKLSIVVSCRANFESTNEIEKFTKLYLDQIDFNDVKEYIQSHCDRPTQLIEAIKEKELYSLVYNPFYLKSIIEYYSEKGSLPETKPQIYDYVIEKSLQIDQKRNRGPVVPIRHTALSLLGKIAFCLQFTEQLSFTIKDLTEGLSMSEKNIAKCTKYTIFRMDTEENYSFEHNAFKEYLTAKHLSGIAFEQLKEAICYPDTDILRPNLYNTVILLVGILQEGDPLVEQLIEWLAEHNPKVLFMCEHHFLSEDRGVEIFKGYFESLKKYGEYISYQEREKTMAFSNVRETILYLFNEAKSEEKLSSNFANAVDLLQFTDMEKLSQQEQDEIYDYGLQLIEQHKDNREQQHLMFHIPGNEYFKTPARIAQLHSIIKDCENPELLNDFFRLVKEVGLSDDYIDWVVSKKECIRDYSVGGTTHIIRKEPLVDIFTSVTKIDNIIKALRQSDYVTGIHFDRDKRQDIISLIFENLHAVPTADVTDKHINELLALLGSEHLSNYGSVDSSEVITAGYRKFFFDRHFDEPVFSQYYAALKKEILTPTLSDSDRMDYFHRGLNVLSTLITKERFNLIMDDADLSDEQRFNGITYGLGQFENISSNPEWKSKIDKLNAKYQPQLIDHTKKAQDGFDALFDYEQFVVEIRKITQKYEAISSDWKQRLKLWKEDHIDESVVEFIWRYGEKDESKQIAMSAVLSNVEKPELFQQFRFLRLEKYLGQNGIVSAKSGVAVSDEQKSQIHLWLHGWVVDIENCQNIHSLARLIDSCEVKLSDAELLSLMPCSYVEIKTKTPPELFHKNIDDSLLDYIHNNISDKRLVVAEIDKILSGDDYDWPLLFEKFAEYIVHYRITSLYKHFGKMMFGEVDSRLGRESFSRNPLQIAKTVLKLGQKGLQILDSLKSNFNDDEKLYYYQIILSDDKLKPKNTSEIATDLHGIYEKVDSNHDKEMVIFLLTGLGDTEGLKMAQNHYSADPSSFISNHPTFSKYGEEHLNIIQQIFEFSNTDDKRERSQMREGTFNWLNAYAMKSEQKRDAIIDYYTGLSEKTPFLLRVVKHLRNRYYAVNSPAMPTAEAVRLYDSIC